MIRFEETKVDIETDNLREISLDNLHLTSSCFWSLSNTLKFLIHLGCLKIENLEITKITSKYGYPGSLLWLSPKLKAKRVKITI